MEKNTIPDLPPDQGSRFYQRQLRLEMKYYVWGLLLCVVGYIFIGLIAHQCGIYRYTAVKVLGAIFICFIIVRHIRFKIRERSREKEEKAVNIVIRRLYYEQQKYVKNI